MKKNNRKQLPFRSSKKNNHRKISALNADAIKYYEQRQFEQANYLYQQVIALDAENITALNGLGLIAMDAGMLSLAVEFFSFAYDAEPANIKVNEYLAQAYISMSRYEEAKFHYLCILDSDENNYAAHGELARLNQLTGQNDLALQHYRYAFDLNPRDPGNLQGMIEIDASAISDEHIDIIEKLLLKSDLPLDVRCGFYFALGNIYDITGRYDEAFANFSVANISKGASFDADKYAAYITDITHTFTPDLFRSHEIYELNSSDQPVFIVGMPGSGTELADQILSAHADVCSAGEINIISGIAKKLNLAIDRDRNNESRLEDLSAESLNNYSRFYINDINDLSSKSGIRKPLRITNKMPANFLHLGLIALLFPKAKVIHCERNPLDVCLASYFDNRKGDNGYACDLNNIAFYYRQYERLMNYWEKVLPINIHTVDYEEMLKKPENATSKMLDYLGLQLHQAGPEKSKNNPVSIDCQASYSPENTNRYSVERWRHYEKYLHFMVKKLNIINDEAVSGRIAGGH